MKQETYGLTLNLQLNLTPDFSIQYYGSPFTSVAKYDKFKLAADTRSSDYLARFSEFKNNEISYHAGSYTVDRGSNTMSFKDPDFSFNEFRSNLVARWEFLPGSSMYFVWANNRSNRDDIYYPGWGSNLDRIFGLPASNTLMMKINYWFSL
ncbi:MAG TPA: DUF5916 domain-containing protein, partial [Pedobacter sp.]|uniref:DUF5916 domain-containing protein n=1 Tax=Pedobacter sp. TaxID=1411316 RepID=UPI002BDD09FC